MSPVNSELSFSFSCMLSVLTESDNSSNEGRRLVDLVNHDNLDNLDRRAMSKACFRSDEMEDPVNERAKLDAELRREAMGSFELVSHSDSWRGDNTGFC